MTQTEILVQYMKNLREDVIAAPNSPIKGREIAADLSLPDTASVRDLVSEARRQKNPIASDSRGYFYATKPEELNHTIAQLTSRIREMQRVIRGVKAAQREMTQTKLGV